MSTATSREGTSTPKSVRGFGGGGTAGEVRGTGARVPPVGLILAVLHVTGAVCSGQVGPWTEHKLDGGLSWAGSAAPADVDGDGDQDVVSTALVGDVVTLHVNALGTGAVWNSHTVANAVDGAGGPALADLDGDGDVDIVVAAAFADSVRWFRNLDGLGTSWFPHVVASTTVSVRNTAVADVDGDGDLDVLSASNRDTDVNWHENVGGAGLAWVEHLVSDVSGAWSVSPVDFDADGDVDCVVAGGVSVAWHGNLQGDGTAWQETVISTDIAFGRSAIAADLDGDGDLDVASGSLSNSKYAWYDNVLGDGSTWTDHLLATEDGANTILATDLDQDGDQDLVTASAGLTDTVAWMENSQGDATVWLHHDVFANPGSNTAYAAVADLDGDGDLDVTSSDSSQNQVRWHENESPAKSLVADVSGLSLSQGGSQVFSFFADPPPLVHFYLLLGSLAGPTPGIVVDGLLLPLTPDGYFLFTLQNPNSAALTNSLGTLAPDGTNPAPVAFNLPQGVDPAFLGINVYHAYLVVDLITQPGSPFVSFTSDWVRVTLDP